MAELYTFPKKTVNNTYFAGEKKFRYFTINPE